MRHATVGPYPPPPAWVGEIETVGVTGTNGKTSTVHWVAAALATTDPAVVCISTLGHHVGGRPVDLPATYDGFVSAMARGRERGAHRAVIELTSAALSSGFMAGWRCRVGVFTNLSRDHLDIHGSAEHYLASKAQLLVALPPGGTAILRRDAPASALLEEVIDPRVRVWTYGPAGSGADLILASVRASWQGTEVALQPRRSIHGLGGLPASLRLEAIGAPYAENAAAALLAAAASDIDVAAAAKAIAATPPPPGRFEVVATRPRVVVDYAHSPDALERTLAVARELCAGALLLVVGAGGQRERGKRRPMGEAAGAADRVWITSDNPRSEDPRRIAAELAAPLEAHPGVEVVLDRRVAIARALQIAGDDDVVLLAGKGHEHSQIDAIGAHPFCDAEVVAELLGRPG